MITRKRKRSDDGINISLDLTIEILKRLPAKSLARFRCVSQQWGTIIGDYIVKNSIVTRSSTQPPHFLFYTRLNRFSVFSYTYPRQITNEKNQLYEEQIVEKVQVMVKFQYVRGLIGFGLPKNNQFNVFKLHNPTTRQSFSLPHTGTTQELFYLFGYDPLNNQYKVVCQTMTKGEPEESFKIFTFGDPINQWRNIQCSLGRQTPFGNAVYINGVIYYRAVMLEHGTDVLVSIDVRFEKFNHVRTPETLMFDNRYLDFVNYQGKLGWICRNNINNEDLDVWIMEDAEIQEWSKIIYIDVFQGIPRLFRFIRFDVTHPGGEIVIIPDIYSKSPADVYFYNPKKNSRRTILIQTPTSSESYFYRIWPITDQVENLMCLL